MNVFKLIKMTSALAILFIWSSCASESVSKPEPARKGNQPIIDGSQDQLTTSCNAMPANSALKRYSIERQTGMSDLCSYMDQGSYKTLVIMLTSPTCLSCKPMMQEIDQYLQRLSQVSFVVAVPNQHSDVESYTFADIKQMADTYAPNATPAFDPNGTMWMELSQDKSNPVFPVVFVINRAGRGQVFQTNELVQTGAIQNLVIPAIQQLNQN